jgi:hypothetical protein
MQELYMKTELISTPAFTRVSVLLSVFIVIFLGSAMMPQFQLEAQQARLGNAEFDLSLQLGLPQGPFQDQLESTGFGIKGMAGIHMPRSPLFFGVDFSFLTFGTDSRKEAFNSNIPDVRVQVDNSYNMASGFGLLRMTGQNFMFRPYVEGLFGVNYLYTQSVVRNSGNDGDEIASDINLDDFTPAYGIGAGLQYLVWDGRQVYGTLVYLNVQARYIRGGNAEYVLPGTIDTSGLAAGFETAESRTDTAFIQIGMSIRM